MSNKQFVLMLFIAVVILVLAFCTGREYRFVPKAQTPVFSPLDNIRLAQFSEQLYEIQYGWQYSKD